MFYTPGIIIQASNNLFNLCAEKTVRESLEKGDILQCRIKGKRLDIDEKSQPVLVSGDRVRYYQEECGHGSILERLERKNMLKRWNIKQGITQVLAANIDYVIVIFSGSSPCSSFLFLDCVLAAATLEEIPIYIAVNKIDCSISKHVAQQLSLYQDIGYHLFYLSAKEGQGLENFHKSIAGSRCVLVGESGVGKSTLLNKLCPEAKRETASVSKKYAVGRHTTSQSCMFLSTEASLIIDTPGINSFDLFTYEQLEIRDGFLEFQEYSRDCAYSSCLHISEPDCALQKALKHKKVSYQRYSNYRKILDFWNIRRQYLKPYKRT